MIIPKETISHSNIYTLQTFLDHLRRDLPSSKMLTGRQKSALIDQIDQRRGRFKGYQDTYPVIRGYWYMLVRDYLMRFPSSEARIYGMDRLDTPVQDSPFSGGSRLEEIPNFQDAGEMIIEAKIPLNGCFMPSLLDSWSRERNRMLPYGHYADECRYRLPSPHLMTHGRSEKKRPSQLTAVYVNGLIPRIHYVHFLQRKEWPVALPVGEHPIGIKGRDQHPLIVFLHDIGHLHHRDSASLDKRTDLASFLMFKAAVSVFPECGDSLKIEPMFDFIAEAAELTRWSDVPNLCRRLRDMRDKLEVLVVRSLLPKGTLSERWPALVEEMKVALSQLKQEFPRENWGDLESEITEMNAFARDLVRPKPVRYFAYS